MNYKDKKINSFFECINEKLLLLPDKRRELIEENYRINRYRHWFYVNHGWKPSKKEARARMSVNERMHKEFIKSSGSVIFPVLAGRTQNY